MEPEEGVANTRLPKIPRNLPSLEALTKVSLIVRILCAYWSRHMPEAVVVDIQ